MAELRVFDTDPTIYLFTSLTAGSSHIITATSRIETILKANKVPFQYKDTATDDLAKKLFQRRASGKKLPLIVKEGYVLGGIEEIEEWNEYDEIREALGVTTAFTAFPAKPAQPSSASKVTAAPAPAAASSAAAKKDVAPPVSAEQNLAIRQMGAEAAKIAAAKKQAPAKISTTNPLLAEKINTPTTPAKSPGGKSLAGGILSPKSIPLPQTPTLATSKENAKPGSAQPSIPKLSDLQKPVHAPPSMHADAANPALSGPPKSSTQKPPTAGLTPQRSLSSSSSTSLHGARIDSEVSKEDIKKAEDAIAIQEESSEDEDEDDEEESSEEEEESSEDEKDAKPAPLAVKAAPAATKAAPAPTKTPQKAAEVEEEEDDDDDEESSEDEDEDEEENSDEESSEEEEAPAKQVKPVATAAAPSTAKPAASSTAKPAATASKAKEEDEDDDDDDDEDDEDGEEEDEDEEESSEEDSSDEEEPAKGAKPVTKTQTQDPKAASKAGTSVKD
ncbi:hypothetical protein IQ07DRAFT_583236 [Pyrenochaeta sp. DS3sAY3a]|nr:hypothetical protein IQ07DRAFT_583236 [Pyrenochaeta sp. DS3sAY3a]